MTLKRLQFKPGVNREVTRYTNESGWYACDKVRFRQGMPEKIGGWERLSDNTYLGVARAMWAWATQNGAAYLGVGTHLKYYLQFGGAYNDITPLRLTTSAGAVTFTATSGSAIITVSHTAHGAEVGDFVTFSGAVSLGGAITAAVLNTEYQITGVASPDEYTVTASVVATAGDVGNGGASVVGAYQLNTGQAIQIPLSGWGAGAWGGGTWGLGAASSTALRIWNNANFGEDLVYGPKGGEVFYWDATGGISARGVRLDSLPGAADVPLFAQHIFVSDTSRFLIFFGTNDYGSTDYDGMVIRWSAQEDVAMWTPLDTNQAGSIRLSNGSYIAAVKQSRQEILVFTDTSVYSMQYVGAPFVWTTNLLATNTSIVNDRAVATSAGVTYWMGDKKFYVFDGRVQQLKCDLLRYVFSDFNFEQSQQVFASTVEQFNEIWWFYPSAGSTQVDRYVVYNYAEGIWYYGTMMRTAWVDASVVSELPIAASYSNRLVYHETGADDGETSTIVPIDAYIASAEFDIDDGHRFGFVWRVLPDVTFEQSTAVNPKGTLTLLPLKGSGAGYRDPASVATTNSGEVVRSATVPVDQYTNQVNVRVRGRQMALKFESNDLGVRWQLGVPRMDIRQDGRA